MTDTPDLKPPTAADPATLLLCQALALMRNWQFLVENSGVIPTPRQLADLHDERREWIEDATTWAKNIPAALLPEIILSAAADGTTHPEPPCCQ